MYTGAVDPELNYVKDDHKKLKKACQEFEAFFMNKLFSSMRKTVQDSGLVKKSMGEKIFTDMMDQEIAKESSQGQGIGLSKMLYDAMSKNLPGSDGNNFPSGKKGTQTAGQFLELQRSLSGTDVASKLGELK